ncbi:MAG: TetR family transcriptional regulator [Oscillospiraceae bacterium]|nr:TetR family transcriptional regulator [Oscillospiraceae bacterium]
MADTTKLWIAEKMKELMRSKRIEKIRVTEICARAGVERPTFYYHFKDKYDLVAWIFFRSSYDTDVISVESSAESMNRMKKDLIFYKRAYEDSSQNALWRYMLEYFSDRYIKIAQEKLGTQALDAQTLFSIRLYCCGAVEMSRRWVLYDDITPAQTEVMMMFRSMPADLGRIYFGGDESFPRP